MSAPSSIDSKILHQLVENSGLRFKRTYTSWIFTCPKCNKPGKLYLRKKDGRFICFSGSCTREGFSGKRPEFALSPLLKTSIRDLQSMLYGLGPTTPIYMPEQAFFDDDDDDEMIELTPEWLELPRPLHHYSLDHKFAAKGIEYLRTRGIDVGLAQKYGIRFSPTENRVIFPVIMDDMLVGWQGRWIGPTSTLGPDGNMIHIEKIKSSPSLPKERAVMFQHNLTDSPHVVLCEGPVDAIKADLCGGNVATMGKAVSPGQIQIVMDGWEELARKNRTELKRRFYSGLDPDAADEVGKLVSELESDAECFQLEPPDDKDLGALSCGEVYDLFRSARKVSSATLFIFLQ